MDNQLINEPITNNQLPITNNQLPIMVIENPTLSAAADLAHSSLLTHPLINAFTHPPSVLLPDTLLS
jgi:hypothetical protein